MDETKESEEIEPERTIIAAELESFDRVFDAPIFDDEDLTGLADYDE